MDTKDYRTKTLLIPRSNPFRNENIWAIAIDVGYSSTKVMSRNCIACFPSYARKMPRDTVSLAKPDNTDIMYRDRETGDIWAVGARAENMNTAESTNDNDAVLYGRTRYFSDNFRIVAQVGLAIGMMANQYGNPNGKEIIVQTGLPSAYYYADDKKDLKAALAGHHCFDLKLGSGPWRTFDFTFGEKDVRVTQQPMGTLASITTDESGRPTPDAADIFRSNALIFDPGFRTGDTCHISGGNTDVTRCNTYDNMSMYEILNRTIIALKRQYNTQLSVPSMQPCLESGFVTARDFSDRKHPKSQRIDFSGILEEETRIVCDEAIDKLMDVYNYFTDIDYLVVTGGLGEVWMPIFKERLQDMQSLTLLPGNRTTDLPQIFSNVRGYYMFRISR